MLVMVVAAVAGANAADAGPKRSAARRAETFSGWQFIAPAKYGVERTAGHVALHKRGSSFACAIALFPLRPRTSALATDAQSEWANIIDGNFTATNVHPAPVWTPRRGTLARATSATVTDANGERAAALHYAVAPPGMIGSVLVTATDARALARCTTDAKALIASLEIDPGSLPPDDPDATPPSPVGTWAASAGDAATATALREYTFAADGTYRFRAEERGGTLAADQWREIDETGTYSLTRNRLTVIPRVSTATLRGDGVPEKATQRRLERVTYTWAKRYRVESSSWALLLFPGEKTARDGEPAAGAELDLGYSYAEGTKPAWSSTVVASPEQPESAR